MVVDRGSRVEVGKMGEGSQMVQTSCYEINKLWGCDVEHGDHS